jgi:hypothetical protein
VSENGQERRATNASEGLQDLVVMIDATCATWEDMWHFENEITSSTQDSINVFLLRPDFKRFVTCMRK